MLLTTMQTALPGWTLAITALDGDVMGFCDLAHRTIWANITLSPRELRTTIMHEIVHAVRGDATDDPAAEQAAEQETAARLIPAAALHAALTYSTHPEDLCDALDVDPCALQTRLRNLTDDELSTVRRMLSSAAPPQPGSRDCAIGRWWAHYAQPAPSPCDNHPCRHAPAPSQITSPTLADVTPLQRTG